MLLTESRKAVIERLARGLNVNPALLPVIRTLLRMVRSLPDHAWRTRQLPTEVLDLRDAFERAKAPERLLFHDLPAALGLPPIGDKEQRDTDEVDEFFDRLNWALSQLNEVTPRAVAQARDELLVACGLPTGASGWEQLRVQARELAPSVTSPALIPFVTRLTTDDDDNTVLESVLALVANRPPRSWTDQDIRQFNLRAAPIGERFQQATAARSVLSEDEESQAESIVNRIRSSVASDIRHTY